MKLSLVIPCFNEEKNIEPFFQKCLENLQDLKVEYIFINDGSKDSTLKSIKDLIKNNKKANISCLNFSRNFGKEAAILAGLKKAQGDYVAIIDADLQQHPRYVRKMVEFLEDNKDYDSVACYQEKRKESKLLIFFKKMFYKLINKFSNVPFYENASDFRLLKRPMVEAVLSMEEYYRFSKGLFSYVGFNTYYMPYEVEKRLHGKSSWNFFKLCKYALNGIVSFTLAPLKLATFIGSISFVASIIYLVVVICQKLFIGIEISGYPTIVCLLLFFGGVQLIFIGIVGEYLGRTYMEVKRRPKYIIKDEINKDNIQ